MGNRAQTQASFCEFILNQRLPSAKIVQGERKTKRKRSFQALFFRTAAYLIQR